MCLKNIENQNCVYIFICVGPAVGLTTSFHKFHEIIIGQQPHYCQRSQMKIQKVVGPMTATYILAQIK